MLPELALYFDLLQTRFDQLKDILEEIGPDTNLLNWRPAGGEQPSVFGIVAHVALNANYWVGHVIGGRAEPPGFDSALEEASGDDPPLLLQLLDSALENTRMILEEIDRKQLDHDIDFADEVFNPRQCILQVLDETAARCGEIETLVRWYRHAQVQV